MEAINFQRISSAIEYLADNFKQQPSLEEVAAHVHLSPFHFQRIFSDWAGLSPKKFIQYLSLEHSKKLLREQKLNLQQTTFETGLSTSSRLHDLFVNIEGMTPSEYQKGGINLNINYSFSNNQFGRVLMAATPRGLCHLVFVNNDEYSLTLLKDQFPLAKFQEFQDEFQQKALNIFKGDCQNLKLQLHLKGSKFQLKVWESLLKIPFAGLSSYSDVAKSMDRHSASRAVGSAVAKNPVAFIIPCHRVIKSTGVIGSYMWGGDRKKAIIGWESANFNKYK